MKTILVGLDDSPRAHAVLETATKLAQSTGGKVLLFRGVSLPPAVPARAYALSPVAVEEMLVDDAKKSLDELARGVPPAVFGGVRVVVGQAWRSICDSAKHENADLIVIGSHSYGGIDRLLGTTAAKVVNHADRSVLVVK